jgi:hypothetical protein
MATDRQYHVTDPDGEQFVFCSACCLLYFSCYGLPAAVEAAGQEGEAA